MIEEVPKATGTAPDVSPVTEEPPHRDLRGPARKHPPEVYLAIALEAWAKAAETLCREEMARKDINGLLANPDRAGQLWILWSLWEEMALALKRQVIGRNADVTVESEQLELFCNSVVEGAAPGAGPGGQDDELDRYHTHEGHYPYGSTKCTSPEEHNGPPEDQPCPISLGGAINDHI